MPDSFLDVDNADWWLATGPGTTLLTTIVIWALASIATAWLRYDATIWGDAAEVIRGRLKVREFIANGFWCDRCSQYWLTIPVMAWFGPISWLAVNALYLLAAKHRPTLKPPPDNNDDHDDVQVEALPGPVPGENASPPAGGKQVSRGEPPLPDDPFPSARYDLFKPADEER